MRKVFVDVEQNLVDPQRVLMTITWLHALGGVPPANIIAGSIRGLYDDRSTRVCSVEFFLFTSRSTTLFHLSTCKHNVFETMLHFVPSRVCM